MQPEGVQLRPRPRTIPRQRQRQRPSPVMAESDPLTALKSTILSKQPITYCTSSGTSCASGPTATHLSLSGRAFAKNSTTRYRSSGASSGSDFYTLDAVYLAWTLRDAPAAEYMKQMREGGLTAGFVSVTERKNVVEWLEGRVGDGSRVVPLGGTFLVFSCKTECMGDVVHQLQTPQPHLEAQRELLVNHKHQEPQSRHHHVRQHVPTRPNHPIR